MTNNPPAWTDAIELVNRCRQSGGKVVFTNGCFDILHVGHIRYLALARKLGDALIVGLNSDSSVRRLKGKTRPIVTETERVEMLLALKAVDGVALFEEDTPYNLIECLMPDILVKGGDWPEDQIVGADLVKSNGGSVKSIQFVEGASTTGIIQRVLAKEQSEK